MVIANEPYCLLDFDKDDFAKMFILYFRILLLMAQRSQQKKITLPEFTTTISINIDENNVLHHSFIHFFTVMHTAYFFRYLGSYLLKKNAKLPACGLQF